MNTPHTTTPASGNELLPQRIPLSEIAFTFPTEKIADLRQKAPETKIVGQNRAVSAIELGLGIHSSGYNIFIMGAPGTGRRTVLSSLLKEYKPNTAELQDIAYAHNYQNPLEPSALFFPAGQGRIFKKRLNHAMDVIYEQAQQIEKSEQFLSVQKKLVSTVDSSENTMVAEFEIEMLNQGFKVLHIKDDSQQSIDLIPLIDEEEISFAELQLQVAKKQFSEEKFNALRETYYNALDTLADLFALMRKNRKETDEKLSALSVELMKPIITAEMEALRTLIGEYPVETALQQAHSKKIQQFLDKTEEDLLKKIPVYTQPFKSLRHKKNFFGRYAINLIHENTENTPYAISENIPSFANLFGTVEMHGDETAPLTNGHLHIRAGSVHRALGGFLVLRLKDLLEEEDSWVYLKRVLQSGAIEIRPSPSGTHASYPFKPEPIPARFKVIIIGGEYTYEILYQEDPDFYKLFKVCAEFDSVMPLTDENSAAVLSLIESFVKDQKSLPFTDCGYAKLLEYAVELSGSRHLISAQFTKISDFVAEANYMARKHGSEIISAEIIEKTIEQRQYLSALPQEKFSELIHLKELLIDTTGTAIGKVNGLAVEERGFHTFGIPVSITAQASPGRGSVINIEREAGLSGEVYDKAHLIITSLLRRKYLGAYPLALSAAICFEQSYSMVDGDSASCAEFFALVSAIAKIPLRQDIAVTGSVNQLGQVQPVGGISEKITGFFDVCVQQGLTGTQGVIIPEGNKHNLFLPARVRTAISENRFTIWTINNVDQGLLLLCRDFLSDDIQYDSLIRDNRLIPNDRWDKDEDKVICVRYNQLRIVISRTLENYAKWMKPYNESVY
ncbi:MAG: Lon protease family protein [Treponema sp.]